MLQLHRPSPTPLPTCNLNTTPCGDAFFTTLAVNRLLSQRSPETAEHMAIIGVLVEKLARLSGLPTRLAARLGLAAQLHDLGKMGILDATLNKPGPLTVQEYECMKRHTLLGRDILREWHHPLQTCAAIIAHQHHERWDGLGYPQGLRGNEIHLFARLTTICDVFDALSRNRAYRLAWLPGHVYDYMHFLRNTAFDPRLLDHFLEHFEDFLVLRQEREQPIPPLFEEAVS